MVTHCIYHRGTREASALLLHSPARILRSTYCPPNQPHISWHKRKAQTLPHRISEIQASLASISHSRARRILHSRSFSHSNLHRFPPCSTALSADIWKTVIAKLESLPLEGIKEATVHTDVHGSQAPQYNHSSRCTGVRSSTFCFRPLCCRQTAAGRVKVQFEQQRLSVRYPGSSEHGMAEICGWDTAANEAAGCVHGFSGRGGSAAVCVLRHCGQLRK
jgi:hypothetical protein